MRTGQAEIFEVASFYAHFDVVKEGETPPPALTIRVCDLLSCELAGAEQLKKALEEGMNPAKVRVLRAPAWGAAIQPRCWKLATTTSTTRQLKNLRPRLLR